MTQVDTALPAVSRRRRSKKLPRHPYDRRSALGRRVDELATVFRSKLGPEASDPLIAAAIMRAAETTALSEHLRAKMLRGEAISPDQVLRATRTADLLTRKLFWADHQRLAPDHRKVGPSLAEYLQQREGAA